MREACAEERAHLETVGAEVLAFGAPSHDNRDAEMLPGWRGSDSDD